MKFHELLKLKHDRNSLVIDEGEIAALLPSTPQEVIQQVYSDHGMKSEFQDQYGSLELSNISWEKVSLTAAEIAICAYNERFSSWFKNVEQRPAAFANQGWTCIDTRRAVVDYWQSHKTWRVPPVFLCGAFLLSTHKELRLVEGHTRVALLRGLLSNGVISSDSKHEIWLGCVCA